MAGVAGSRIGSARLIASLPVHLDQYMIRVKEAQEEASALQATAAEFQPKTDHQPEVLRFRPKDRRRGKQSAIRRAEKRLQDPAVQ